MSVSDLTFGWFLPTSGDSTCLGDPEARIVQSRALFDEIVDVVDRGGFKYLLMPVNATCWEATVTASYYAARTRNVAPLIALRSGYCNPTLSAKMYATLDQLSGGRLCVNLIAGINDDDTQADGLHDSKQVRYEKMDEEVQIMKRLWSSNEPIGFEGKHYRVNQVIEPKPLQQPHPPFFLGGGSAQAQEISARHSTVHLFWGDRPETIAEKIQHMRGLAAAHGREHALRFGMRLQIICASTEKAAWDEAHRLIAGATRFNLANMRTGQDAAAGIRRTSEANQRVWQLLEESGEEMKIHPHLWTGISTVRAGAGIAVVGTPAQIASTLDEFVEAGCSSFCLSGYPHAKAAETFSREVLPYFKGRLSQTLPRAA
ncbi:MAG: LLM class flavin-dependent oxidoreductase [Gammaproteobacteria bacterium]|nr:LLM class flavin-dependent oxidoreductase [Gammaproteobacteria bacterium]